MSATGPLTRLWHHLRRWEYPYAQVTNPVVMPDNELIACTQPPPPFITALQDQDEQGMGQLLDLLFACHAKVDDTEDLSPWHECEAAWDVKRRYDQGQVVASVMDVAPTWDEAMRVSEAWLPQWRHTCGEFERWLQYRSAPGGDSALSFFRAMMITRCQKLRPALILGNESGGPSSLRQSRMPESGPDTSEV